MDFVKDEENHEDHNHSELPLHTNKLAALDAGGKEESKEAPELQSEDGEESDKEDFNDWVEEQDDDHPPIKGFFSEIYFSSIPALLEYELETTHFDFRSLVTSHCRSSFDFIKLVNFIRAFALRESSQRLTLSELIEQLNILLEESEHWRGEEFMKPVLEEDALLFLYEESFAFLEDDDEEENAVRKGKEALKEKEKAIADLKDSL